MFFHAVCRSSYCTEAEAVNWRQFFLTIVASPRFVSGLSENSNRLKLLRLGQNTLNQSHADIVDLPSPILAFYHLIPGDPIVSHWIVYVQHLH